MNWITNIENTIVNDLAVAKGDMLAFLAKVKTGVQLVESDFSAAVNAIASHITSINSDWAAIQNWLTTNLPTIENLASAVLPASDGAVLQQAIAGTKQVIADANLVVTGLNTVATSVNAGQSDVTSVVSGIATVAKASQSTNSVIMALANLPVPTQTQAVSQPSPPID